MSVGGEKLQLWIETTEMLIDLPSLRPELIAEAREALHKAEAPPEFIDEWERNLTDEDLWMMLICNFAVKWAINHNIGPLMFNHTMMTAAAYHYGNDIKRRLMGHTSDLEEFKKRMDDDS